MRKIASFLHRPLTLCFFLLIAQLILYIITTYRPYIVAPPGYSYTAMGNYYSYPNFILQAKDGAWDTFDLGTTLPTVHVRAQLFFVVLGKIAWLFRLHQITMYRVAQITGGVAIFLLSYWLIRLFLPKHMHAAAVFFVLGCEIGPLWTDVVGKPLLAWPPSFASQISFQRHFWFPHHNWAEAFGLILFGMLYLSIQKTTFKRIFVILCIAITATITLPSYVITMMIAVGPMWLLWGAMTKTLRKILPPLILASVAIILTGFFVKSEFARGVPWSLMPAAEKTWWKNADQITYYLSSLTLYYPFFLLAIAAALGSWRQWQKSIRFAFLFSLAWLLVPIVCIPISTQSWFPIANFRLTDGYHYFAAGMLATIGFYQGLTWITSKKIQTIVRACLLIPIIVLSIIFTTAFTKGIWDSQNALWSNVYPATSTMEAIEFMATLPKYSGIMVREYAGNIMAAYADVKIFLGAYHFPDFWQRSAVAQQFLSGTLTDDQAKDIVRKYNVSYVFYGPDEQSWNTTGTLYPDLLTPIHTTATVTVFAVNK